MPSLRLEKRFAPWWAGLICLALIALFGSIIWTTFRQHASREEFIRLFLPMYALGSYLGFAVAINIRSAQVFPDRVAIRNGPLPIGSNETIHRPNIRFIYVRHVVSIDEDDVEMANFYSAGVEVEKSRQIDISSPHNSAEQAATVAYEIARVLNSMPGGNRLEVFTAPYDPADPRRKWQLFAWCGLLLLSVFAGAWWETAGR